MKFHTNIFFRCTQEVSAKTMLGFHVYCKLLLRQEEGREGSGEKDGLSMYREHFNFANFAPRPFNALIQSLFQILCFYLKNSDIPYSRKI